MNFKKICGKWIIPSLIIISVISAFLIPPALFLQHFIPNLWTPLYRLVGINTETDVANKIGPQTRVHLKKYYENAGVEYPGDKAAFLFFKEEKKVEIWAQTKNKWNLIHTYSTNRDAICAGKGLHKITGLNSNLFYSLSMRFETEYPLYRHSFDIFLDKKVAPPDRAITIGDDEFSIGHLNVSENEFKELYILAHDVNINNVEVIMTPHDLRKKDPEIKDRLSKTIKESLEKFRVK